MRFCVFLSLLSYALSAQDSKLQFEVASVKLSTAQVQMAISGGPETDDPGRITYTNVPLRLIMTRAYGIKDSQLVGPDWLMGVRIDIAAKVPEGTTRDQSLVMTQNLIIERFGAKIHRETHEVQGYELVIGKGGPKLQDAASATGDSLMTNARGALTTIPDQDGFPQLPPGRKGALRFMVAPGRTRMSARMQPAAQIAQFLENNLRVPVIDKTGLNGTYDYNLDFAAGNPSGSIADPNASTPLSGIEAPVPPLTLAVETLGLKLESQKLPIEVTVIDQMSKTPIE